MDESVTLLAIGTMSGTSLDGIDAAVIETDGRDVIRTGSALHRPYGRELKDLIRGAISAALSGNLEKGLREAAEIGVTDAHAEAVAALLDDAGLVGSAVDVIGLHGQTILHRPAGPTNPVGETIQLGHGARMADATGIDVVNDFRRADVEAGGEGAPFAPAYHRALVASSQAPLAGAVGVVNLGGVANITYVLKDARDVDLVAFDCGPGNGLIDEWVELKTGAAYDRDGELARGGRVHEDVVRAMLDHEYLRRKPPKSIDRYDFGLNAVAALGVEDGAATLTAFTAHCIADAQAFLPERPERWVICGGGRHNRALMDALDEALEGLVVSAEDMGWRGDDLEAECFGYLAVRSVKGLALSFPGTTGVPSPMPGGTVHRVSR